MFETVEAKRAQRLTLDILRESILDAGLATADELHALAVGLDAFTDDPETITGLPRVFRAYGRRSRA
jgi:hypothetical protein